MLQAFVDDSGRHAKDGVFVFAGLVSTAERWAKFSDEWKEALSVHPSVDYFKASEAAACEGQFGRLSYPERDDRLLLLNKIINRNVMFANICMTKIGDWNAAAKNQVAVALDTPFFHTAFVLMLDVLKYMRHTRSRDTVDFIFDDQHDKEFFEIQQIWQLHKDGLRAKERWRMGNLPITRNDKDFLPLQGADLFAWSARRLYADALSGADSDKVDNIIQEPFQIPTGLRLIEKGDIEVVIRGTQAANAGLPYLDRSERDRRHKPFAVRRSKLTSGF